MLLQREITRNHKESPSKLKYHCYFEFSAFSILPIRTKDKVTYYIYASILYVWSPYFGSQLYFQFNSSALILSKLISISTKVHKRGLSTHRG